MKSLPPFQRAKMLSARAAHAQWPSRPIEKGETATVLLERCYMLEKQKVVTPAARCERERDVQPQQQRSARRRHAAGCRFAVAGSQSEPRVRSTPRQHSDRCRCPGEDKPQNVHHATIPYCYAAPMPLCRETQVLHMANQQGDEPWKGMNGNGVWWWELGKKVG